MAIIYIYSISWYTGYTLYNHWNNIKTHDEVSENVIYVGLQ